MKSVSRSFCVRQENAVVNGASGSDQADAEGSEQISETREGKQQALNPPSQKACSGIV